MRKSLAFIVLIAATIAALWGPYGAVAVAQGVIFRSPGGGTFTGGVLTSQLQEIDGTGASPSYSFTNSSNSGMYNIGSGLIAFSSQGVGYAGVTGDTFELKSTTSLAWSSSTLGQSVDTGFKRVAASVAAPSNGSSGNGWLQQNAGRVRLASPFTDTSASLTNTALSITVITGRAYGWKMVFFFADSTAADGVKIDFNGGTAGVTDFRAHCIVTLSGNTTLQGVLQTTALATVVSIASLTNTSQHMAECSGTFQPSSSGTFIVRAAQNTHSTGTLTVNTGSWLWFEDEP